MSRRCWYTVNMSMVVPWFIANFVQLICILNQASPTAYVGLILHYQDLQRPLSMVDTLNFNYVSDVSVLNF
jgi:hypothetical protein